MPRISTSLLISQQGQPGPDQTMDILMIIGAAVVLLSTLAGYLWGMAVNTGQGASSIPVLGASLGFVIGFVIALSILGVALAVRRQR